MSVIRRKRNQFMHNKPIGWEVNYQRHPHTNEVTLGGVYKTPKGQWKAVTFGYVECSELVPLGGNHPMGIKNEWETMREAIRVLRQTYGQEV